MCTMKLVYNRTLNLIINRVRFFFKLRKKYINIHLGEGGKLRKPSISVVNWVSPCLSFFLSASTAATYIFIAPTCTTTIIHLEPDALNAEFQHFIPKFNQISYFMGTRKEGLDSEKRPNDRVTLWLILIYTLTRPKTFTQGHISVLEKYLHWPCVKINKYKIIYTLKVWTWFTLTWDLHALYTAIDNLMPTLWCKVAPTHP